MEVSLAHWRTMSGRRPLRIALLLCDTPLPAVVEAYGDYHAIFSTWLRESLASYPDRELASRVDLVVDPYDVVNKHEFPSEDKLKAGAEGAYHVVMMTGSKHTAYDTENPFVPPLVEFIRKVASSEETQHVKIVGICFGHQIAAIALGGECVRGTNGWEVGVYGNEVTEAGKYWWCGDVEGQGGDDKVYLEQMHKDHVPAVPPGCQLLLKTPRYPVHSFVKLHPASTPAKPVAQVFTVQGHPEFTPGIVSPMVETRASQGIFDDATAAEARRRLGGKDGSGGEGFGRVGWAVWRVMLQEIPQK